MGNEADTVLRVRDLSVGFDTDDGALVAVDKVSFAVGKGKTLGIVGESGCGKSVTAFSVMRLLPQPMGNILGGEIMFGGEDLAQVPDEPDGEGARGGDQHDFPGADDGAEPGASDRATDRRGVPAPHEDDERGGVGGVGRDPREGGDSRRPRSGWASTRTSFRAGCGSG